MQIVKCFETYLYACAEYNKHFRGVSDYTQMNN